MSFAAPALLPVVRNRVFGPAICRGFKLLDVEWWKHCSTLWLTTKSSSPVTYSVPLLNELVAVADLFQSLDPLVPDFVIYRSGTPSIFSLGGHLSYFSSCIENAELARLERYALLAVDAIWMAMTGCGSSNTTSIALVEGEAQGGGFEAALAAHVLVAEQGVKFGFPESLFGLFPGMGGVDLLRARGGAALVERLVAGAVKITAEELYEHGVVDYLARPGRGASLIRDILECDCSREWVEKRERFREIRKADLAESAILWANQAIRITERNRKTIRYLIQAQDRYLRRQVALQSV